MSDGLDLGPDFVWGAATSAYQIEGAAGEDGRAPSIWDTFCQVPGAIDNGDSGAEACDHYHRWPRDIALMGELGLDAYRFSVAWPRVLPEGTGAVNQAGLDFYDRLVDGLLAAGIRPFTTLYHWDLPQALQDRGGWPSRDTAFAFAEFAAVVAARLGDRVSDWFTVNEPLCSAWIGHLEGWMAPGARDIALAVPAAHHLLLAHGLGAGAVRGAATAPARIGVVLNLSPCVPAGREERDTAAAWRADGHTNRWWLEALDGRGYAADMLGVYQVEPPVRAGDLELIAEMGWEVSPDGLEELLLRLTGEYQVPRLYVTESGSAWADDVHQDGNIADAERTRYLEAHLAASGRAVRRGVPLAGYFVWSLLDNFEWAYGYAKRFGLVHVDYPTQRRTIKASGRRYAEIIRAYKRGEPVFQTMTSRSSR